MTSKHCGKARLPGLKSRCFFLALALGGTGLCQVTTTRFENRDSWTLEGPRLRATILQSGGHVGEIVLKGADAISPLWLRPRTVDPDQYDPARQRGGRFMSGLLGHNVCFPYWGDPSPAERAAGMEIHGETGVLRWKLVTSGADWLTASAELPESRTRFTRTVRLSGQIVGFEETAENLSGLDRIVGWCQHVSIGPPFMERGVTVFDASLTRGFNALVVSDNRRGEFFWPEGLERDKIDLRRVRNLEKVPGFVDHFLVDTGREYGFFAAFNPRLRLLFGYIFPRKDYAWLNVWEELGPKQLVRAMEFANTPIHKSARELVRTPEMFGAPTFEWLGGRQKLRKRFWAFSARVPENYHGVADVRWSKGKLEIVERETRGIIKLDFHPAPR